MTRAASIAREALDHGLKAKVPFFVTPGSDQIYQTCKRDGLLDIFEQAGGTVPACLAAPHLGGSAPRGGRASYPALPRDLLPNEEDLFVPLHLLVDGLRTAMAPGW